MPRPQSHYKHAVEGSILSGLERFQYFHVTDYMMMLAFPDDRDPIVDMALVSQGHRPTESMREQVEWFCLVNGLGYSRDHRGVWTFYRA